MAQPDTLHLGTYRPPVSLLQETIDAFQHEVAADSKRHILAMKAEMSAPGFTDEHGFYDYFRELDGDSYAAPPPKANLVLRVNNREREHAGLDSCLSLLRSEPWTQAALNISTEEIVEVGDDSVVWGHEFSLRFEISEHDGKVLTDYPSEEARARILGPLTEAANNHWRKHPESRAVKPKVERPAFNFNDDVLKHPLVVNAFSGVAGAVLGFIGGLIVASMK